MVVLPSQSFSSPCAGALRGHTGGRLSSNPSASALPKDCLECAAIPPRVASNCNIPAMTHANTQSHKQRRASLPTSTDLEVGRDWCPRPTFHTPPTSCHHLCDGCIATQGCILLTSKRRTGQDARHRFVLSCRQVGDRAACGADADFHQPLQSAPLTMASTGDRAKIRIAHVFHPHPLGRPFGALYQL